MTERCTSTAQFATALIRCDLPEGHSGQHKTIHTTCYVGDDPRDATARAPGKEVAWPLVFMHGAADYVPLKCVSCGNEGHIAPDCPNYDNDGDYEAWALTGDDE